MVAAMTVPDLITLFPPFMMFLLEVLKSIAKLDQASFPIDRCKNGIDRCCGAVTGGQLTADHYASSADGAAGHDGRSRRDQADALCCMGPSRRGLRGRLSPVQAAG